MNKSSDLISLLNRVNIKELQGKDSSIENEGNDEVKQMKVHVEMRLLQVFLLQNFNDKVSLSNPVKRYLLEDLNSSKISKLLNNVISKILT